MFRTDWDMFETFSKPLGPSNWFSIARFFDKNLYFVIFKDFTDQEKSSEIDTFQTGEGAKIVGFCPPPSVAKLVGQNVLNHKLSLFRSIKLVS